MIKPFCDWLEIYQIHPQELPRTFYTLSTRSDEHGELLGHKVQPKIFRGSNDTSIMVSCDGHKVTLSGNIGRFDRPDNLFGFSVRRCVELASDFVQALGYPRFSVGYSFSSDLRHGGVPVDAAYRGAIITRVDLTSNFKVQTHEKDRILTTLSGWKLNRQEQPTKLYKHGCTWGEGSSSVYCKMYDKSVESGIYPENDKLAPAVLTTITKQEHYYSYFRFEASLKKKFLKNHSLHRLDAWLLAPQHWEGAPMTNIVDITLYNKYFSQLERAEKIVVPADLFGSLPRNLAQYARQHFDGHDLSKVLTKATYYRVRKKLIAFGIDIASPMNVERLPQRVNIIKFESVPTPVEYRDTYECDQFNSKLSSHLRAVA